MKLIHRTLRRFTPLLIESAAALLHVGAWFHHAFVVVAITAVSLVRRVRMAMRDLYARLILQFVRLRVHYFVEVSEKAKCPACGVRAKHRIVWSDTYQAVMHECERCKAQWGEPPVAKLESWHVKPLPVPGEPDSQPRTTSKIRQVV